MSRIPGDFKNYFIFFSIANLDIENMISKKLIFDYLVKRMVDKLMVGA